MGITLWIVPPQLETTQLKTIMDNPPLDDITDDEPYPSFHPHITLGTFPADTPIETLRAAVPALEAPLKIEFKSVDVGDHYFRSVLIAIENNTGLTSLHAAVHEKLQMPAKTPKYPHLSLYYIPDSRANERKRVREEMWNQGTIVQVCEGRVGLRSGRCEGDIMGGFEGREVWIADCEGAVKDWKVVDKVKMCL